MHRAFLIESSVHSDKFHIASTPVSLNPQASRINPAPVSSDMASFFQRAQAPALDLSPPTDEVGHACHPSLDLEALARWQQVISVGVHARKAMPKTTLKTTEFQQPCDEITCPNLWLRLPRCDVRVAPVIAIEIRLPRGRVQVGELSHDYLANS